MPVCQRTDARLVGGRLGGVLLAILVAIAHNGHMDDNDSERIERALRLVRQMIPLADEAERQFKGARTWGAVDIMGGGLFTNLAKHAKLNKASDAMNQLNGLLQQLNGVLQRIVIPTDFSMNTNTFATFADFFFDGIVADTYMQSKIVSSLKQVRQLQEKLHSLESQLVRLRAQH